MLQECKTEQFVFYLCPEYSMVCQAATVEVLNATNLVLGYERYESLYATVDGEPVMASNGVNTNADMSIADLRKSVLSGDRPRVVLVCGGLNIEQYEDKSLFAALRECKRQKIQIGGLSSGTYLVAAAKLLSGRSCVAHWETAKECMQKFDDVVVKSDLYEIDEQFCFCAGGLAGMDMMLALLSKELDPEVLREVCDRLLADRIRSPAQPQRLLKSSITSKDKVLLAAMDLMEKNIAKPLSISQMADLLGCSRRNIERKFEKEIGRSPASFYLQTRLEQAEQQLQNSGKSVSQIAHDVGFSFYSHFSKAYKAHFGVTPKQFRNGTSGHAT